MRKIDDTTPNSVPETQDPANGLRSLCVFSGSRMGTNPHHQEAAQKLGRMMAAQGIRMVYGGGNIGLMGAAARAALENGGEVIGVIPDFLMTLEVGNPGVTELIVVETMHERKARMFGLSDAFLVLPGGLGTLDETIEIATWKQLQLHAKPIVLLNIDGYWDDLAGLLETVVEGGFAHSAMPSLFSVVDSVDAAFDAAATAEVPGREVLLSHLQAE